MATPIPSAGTICLFDPEALSLSNGDPVSSWQSSAGSNTACAPANTGSNRPTYIASGTAAGKPTVRFTRSSNQSLKTQTDMPELGGVHSYVGVTKCVGSAGDNTRHEFHSFYNGSSRVEEFYENGATPAFVDRLGTAGVGRFGTYTMNAFEPFIHARNGGFEQVLAAGDLWWSRQFGSSSRPPGADRFALGVRWSSSGDADHFDGDWAVYALRAAAGSWEGSQTLLYQLLNYYEGGAGSANETLTATAAETDVSGCYVTVTLEGATTTPPFMVDDTVPVTVEVTSPVPSGGTKTRTIKALGVTNATLDDSNQTVLTFVLAQPLFVEDTDDAVLKIPSRWIMDFAGNANEAITAAVTNNSTVSYPTAPVGRWADMPIVRVDAGAVVPLEASVFHIGGTGPNHVEGVQFFYHSGPGGGPEPDSQIGEDVPTLSRSTRWRKTLWCYCGSVDTTGWSEGVHTLYFKAAGAFGPETCVRDGSNPGSFDFPKRDGVYAFRIIVGNPWTDYYVSASSGDDGNDGLSEASPKATIAAALSAAASAGHAPRINISRETHAGNFSITDAAFETANIPGGVPVVIQPWGDGDEKPLIDPTTTIFVDPGTEAWFRNLALDPIDGSAVVGGPVSNKWDVFVQLENVDIDGSAVGRYNWSANTSNYGGSTCISAVFGGTITERGGFGATISRGTTCNIIQSDIFQRALFSAEVQINDHDPGSSGAHADVHQIQPGHWQDPADSEYGGDLNILIINFEDYGVKDSQLIFSSGSGSFTKTVRNIAYVNFLVDGESIGGGNSSWGIPTDHLMLLHLSVNRAIARLGSTIDSSTATNLYIRNCVLRLNGNTGNAPRGCFGNNHFVESTSWTANNLNPMLGGSSMGEATATWQEWTADNYYPTAILEGRIAHDEDLIVPFDLFGEAVVTGGAIGAAQTASGARLAVRFNGILRDSEDTIDLGTIPVGSEQTWEITVRNVGGSTLTVTTPTDVSDDFTLSADVDDSTLDPAQSDTIVIALDDSSTGGVKSGTVTIVTDDPESPFVLNFIVEVIAHPAELLLLDGSNHVESGALFELPDTAHDDETAAFQKTLTIKNNTAESITINRVRIVGFNESTGNPTTNDAYSHPSYPAGQVRYNHGGWLDTFPEADTVLDPGEEETIVVRGQVGPQYSADQTVIGDAIFFIFLIEYTDGSGSHLYEVQMVGATEADGDESITLSAEDFLSNHAMQFIQLGAASPTLENPRKLSPALASDGHDAEFAIWKSRAEAQGWKNATVWMPFGQTPKPFGQISVYGDLPRCAWQEVQEDAAAQAVAFEDDFDHWFNQWHSGFGAFHDISDMETILVYIGTARQNDRTIQPILTAGDDPRAFVEEWMTSVEPFMPYDKCGIVFDAPYGGSVGSPVAADDPRYLGDKYIRDLLDSLGREVATEPYRQTNDVSYAPSDGWTHIFQQRDLSFRNDPDLYSDASTSAGLQDITKLSVFAGTGEGRLNLADSLPWVFASFLWRRRGVAGYFACDLHRWVTHTGKPLVGEDSLHSKIIEVLDKIAPGGASAS